MISHFKEVCNLNTEFLDELILPTEEIEFDYKFTDRYLYFIYLRGNNQLTFHREIDMAIEEEIELIRNECMKIPSVTLIADRNFDEYNVVMQSTLLMCTRMTNIRKLLCIAEVFEDLYPRDMVKKLKHTLNVLQKEFKTAYGKFYIENVEKLQDFKFINGRNYSVIEYLVNKDLNTMFKAKELSNDEFYNKYKKNLYAYVSVLYLGIELDYLHSDIQRVDNKCKSEMDFISYRKFSDSLYKELELWHNKYVPLIQRKANYDELGEHRQIHQLIVIGDVSDLNDDIEEEDEEENNPEE